MKIVSIVKDSFQEYAGEWAFTVFCYGCNFKCQHCYNLETVTDKTKIIGDFKDIFHINVTPAHTAVVFLGGEPTIWKDELISDLKFCKSKGLKTKLFTNGSNPDVIEVLEQNYIVDAYSIDLKAISNVEDVIGTKIDNFRYLHLIDKSIKSIKNKKNLEIRTTDFGLQDINEIKKYVEINYPGIKHIIQKPFKCQI